MHMMINSPTPFSKKSRFSISLDQQSGILNGLIYCMSMSRTTKMYWKDHTDNLFLILIMLFEKTKRGLEPVSLPWFVHDFWRNIFLTLYFINLPNFITWLSLLYDILGNKCLIVNCRPVCDVIKFEINHSFLTKSFLTTTQEKINNIFVIFKRLSLKQIKPTFL